MPHTQTTIDVLVAFFELQKNKLYIHRFCLVHHNGKYVPVLCTDKNQAHRFTDPAQAHRMLQNIAVECKRNYKTEWVAVAANPLSLERPDILSTFVND